MFIWLRELHPISWFTILRLHLQWWQWGWVSLCIMYLPWVYGGTNVGYKISLIPVRLLFILKTFFSFFFRGLDGWVRLRPSWSFSSLFCRFWRVCGELRLFNYLCSLKSVQERTESGSHVYLTSYTQDTSRDAIRSHKKSLKLCDLKDNLNDPTFSPRKVTQ